MTATGTGAFEAILTHHTVLADGVDRRVAALSSTVEDGARYETAAGELLAYLTHEVLPHVAAEERTVYQAAAGRQELSETVAGMLDEHRGLEASAAWLATAADGPTSAAVAQTLGSLFAGHVAKENELLLPVLAANPAVDLAVLLAEMHELTDVTGDEAPPGAALTSQDTEAVLVRLLLDAGRLLAEAGQGDRACRLAGEAWATVRVGRPDLAVRVAAALHRLVRSVTCEAVTPSSSRPPAGNAGPDAALDVRALAPAQRHEKIFATCAALGPGTGFVLVNDHDPKPLRYQFEAEHPGRFTWDVLEAGPIVWRVRIDRPASADTAAPEGPEPELDVRRLAHGQRHDVIFATFDALDPGGGFVLVNDHDPKPLRYQLEAQHLGGFSWDYLQAGPEVWRVRIGRSAGTGR